MRFTADLAVAWAFRQWNGRRNLPPQLSCLMFLFYTAVFYSDKDRKKDYPIGLSRRALS